MRCCKHGTADGGEKKVDQTVTGSRLEDREGSHGEVPGGGNSPHQWCTARSGGEGRIALLSGVISHPLSRDDRPGPREGSIGRTRRGGVEGQTRAGRGTDGLLPGGMPRPRPISPPPSARQDSTQDWDGVQGRRPWGMVSSADWPGGGAGTGRRGRRGSGCSPAGREPPEDTQCAAAVGVRWGAVDTAREANLRTSGGKAMIDGVFTSVG